MRGMCSLCDRSKINGHLLFWCFSCHTHHSITEFGHMCVRCKLPRLCTDCYSGYGMCIECQSQICHVPTL
jgi:hypothetical protein